MFYIFQGRYRLVGVDLHEELSRFFFAEVSWVNDAVGFFGSLPSIPIGVSFAFTLTFAFAAFGFVFAFTIVFALEDNVTSFFESNKVLDTRGT